jgi:hypothetical protein
MKSSHPKLVIALLALAVAGIETGCSQFSTGPSVAFDTPFQAILLANGSVYFGKLQGWGTSRPVLTEVFYVVSKTDPTTKEVKNILVKRGKEWHEPDKMYLNPSQIVFVEPVGKDSKVAHLIVEAGG